jgi:Flp pilus assembly protein TadD
MIVLSLVTGRAGAASFGDANWISGGGFPGTDYGVRAAVQDGAGNLYIGGEFGLAAADALVKGRPDELEGWINRSFALHEMDRTAEAQEKLRPTAEKFPNNWQIQYNLACYACQLGEIEEARAFLARAIEWGDADKAKLMALDDQDLAKLFTSGDA